MVDFQQLGSLISQFSQQYGSHNPGADVSQYSHENTYNDYQQFAQQASPEQIYNSHQQYYQQLPEDQRQGLMSSLMGALRDHGIRPDEVGVDNDQPTPSNLAKVNQFIAQKPDLMDKILGPNGALSSPLAKVAMVGALAFAAKHVMPK